MFRFPEEWLERIDAVAKEMSHEWAEASRNDALCFIVSKGLEVIEREQSAPKSAPTKKSKR
jgi:hypothetical protein